VSVRDDIGALLRVMPPDIRGLLEEHPQRSSLVEIVLDLGRRPEARFAGQRAESLREEEVTLEELEAAASSLGDFGGDNRAGIAGTLHRFSAIRNRRGKVVGLTCRVGRVVSGHVELIRDFLFADSSSVLFLGAPGVGKTTVIRELARVLADEGRQRVVVLDTSNEIGGDGDVPHPALGGARRMQVPSLEAQHLTMIQAVQNHMPQVIIVDEVGTEEEALACRTIAERGVRLIATAHGRTLADLLKNPTLVDLVGGIQSVTLGDDEARSRGTQKSVLERQGSATFPTLIELRDRNTWLVHDTELSVDALLAGRLPVVEVRSRDATSQKVVISAAQFDVGGQFADSARASQAPLPPPLATSAAPRKGRKGR